MAITHEVAHRNSFAGTVSAAVDAGAGAGLCVLKAGVNSAATIVLNDPAFTGPVAGVLTLDVAPVPEDPNATGDASMVDTMEFQDSVGNVVFTGDDMAGGDLTLSKNPIDAGDVVQMTAFTYTASP